MVYHRGAAFASASEYGDGATKIVADERAKVNLSEREKHDDPGNQTAAEGLPSWGNEHRKMPRLNRQRGRWAFFSWLGAYPK